MMYAAGVATATVGNAERPRGLSPLGPRASLSEVWTVSWGRCDDTFYRHPKVAELDDELRKGCIALYWMAISWSNDHLTDGRVSTGTLRVLGGESSEADELVRVGLWDRMERGFLVHDWADFNQTKAHVMEVRALRSVAGKAGADSKWHGKPSGNVNGKLPDKSDAPSPVPRTPSSPVPRNPLHVAIGDAIKETYGDYGLTTLEAIEKAKVRP